VQCFCEDVNSWTPPPRLSATTTSPKQCRRGYGQQCDGRRFGDGGGGGDAKEPGLDLRGIRGGGEDHFLRGVGFDEDLEESRDIEIDGGKGGGIVGEGGINLGGAVGSEPDVEEGRLAGGDFVAVDEIDVDPGGVSGFAGAVGAAKGGELGSVGLGTVEVGVAVEIVREIRLGKVGVIDIGDVPAQIALGGGGSVEGDGIAGIEGGGGDFFDKSRRGGLMEREEESTRADYRCRDEIFFALFVLPWEM
jgi:hypothetical protein